MYFLLITIQQTIFWYDIWFYVSHRILHTNYLYKTVHFIHHEPFWKTMTWKDTNHGHIFESVFQGIGLFLYPGVVWYLSRDLILFPVSIAWLYIGIRGWMRHDHRCVWIIGNYHLLHHKSGKYNYGEEWLDFLLNTRYKKEGKFLLKHPTFN
jgi:sterol desaturase/sphingolipid hydroxylase (fatty acid hydroxylase superfamily)